MKKELQNLSKSELIDRLLSMEKDLDKRSQSLENKLNQSVSHIKILSQKLEQTEEQLRLFKRKHTSNCIFT
jgi:hypothetical protein